MSKVPPVLVRSLAALVVATGAGVGGYVAVTADNQTYVEAVAKSDASMAVRIAQVMGAYYESSNRHIGTPYVDKLGNGQPLTVCAGVTGAVAKIDARHTYSPAECAALEQQIYRTVETQAIALTDTWARLTPWQQATIIDFVYNVGPTQYRTSTMRRKFNEGDVVGACRENPRWVYARGQVLPGLVTRRGANAEICESWDYATALELLG